MLMPLSFSFSISLPLFSFSLSSLRRLDRCHIAFFRRMGDYFVFSLLGVESFAAAASAVIFRYAIADIFFFFHYFLFAAFEDAFAFFLLGFHYERYCAEGVFYDKRAERGWYCLLFHYAIFSWVFFLYYFIEKIFFFFMMIEWSH